MSDEVARMILDVLCQIRDLNAETLKVYRELNKRWLA